CKLSARPIKGSLLVQLQGQQNVDRRASFIEARQRLAALVQRETYAKPQKRPGKKRKSKRPTRKERQEIHAAHASLQSTQSIRSPSPVSVHSNRTFDFSAVFTENH
ncbi:hypothetical protein PFISCL1PPCAC_22135, partial [Pristionchus fissidentatus]